jgi:hypothetical protein
MVDVSSLVGTLYYEMTQAEEFEEQDKDQDGREDLYLNVFFEAEDEGIVLYFADRYVNFSDETTEHEEERITFYPNFNETKIVPEYDVLLEDPRTLRENVTLKYTTVDGQLFIQSSSKRAPAYSGYYLFENETIYQVLGVPLENSNFTTDPFINVGGAEQAVLVENIETGARGPTPQEQVYELIENDENNTFIEVQEPTATLLDRYRDKL